MSHNQQNTRLTYHTVYSEHNTFSEQTAHSSEYTVDLAEHKENTTVFNMLTAALRMLFLSFEIVQRVYPRKRNQSKKSKGVFFGSGDGGGSNVKWDLKNETKGESEEQKNQCVWFSREMLADIHWSKHI